MGLLAQDQENKEPARTQTTAYEDMQDEDQMAITPPGSPCAPGPKASPCLQSASVGQGPGTSISGSSPPSQNKASNMEAGESAGSLIAEMQPQTKPRLGLKPSLGSLRPSR